MKITQYCSVCKEELAMEMVPTGDSDDDGVIWMRCPRCQGFLPKISSSFKKESAPEPATTSAEAVPEEASPEAEGHLVGAESFAPESAGVVPQVTDGKAATTPTEEPSPDSAPSPKPETEYAAQLAEADFSDPIPYRPWQRYRVGDVIHHLAWDDCGLVVEKESLPGSRSVVKVYFEKAGVVRLIEGAPEA